MTFDPYKWLDAQDDHPGGWGSILAEILNGEKETCWHWFVFPQIRGLGQSINARYYAIDGIQEAIEYYEHPVLGSRLDSATELLLETDKRMDDIMGHLDALKTRSSMTLFDLVNPHWLFAAVIEKHYDMERCPKTYELLGIWSEL